MIDISAFMDQFLTALEKTMGDRVRFVGLQGSYGRGEATQTSDIDVVVILDRLTASDIALYRAMLDTLPHRELICGFLSGWDELMRWEPSDLFQFYYDTEPVRGSLDALLPLIDGDAVERAIRIGAGNIYHGCVHNMLHERNADVLRGLYKGAAFVVQASVFRRTGEYRRCREALLGAASAAEREILEIGVRLKNGDRVEFERMSAILYDWARELLVERGVTGRAPDDGDILEV